jgi:hypothetical protein
MAGRFLFVNITVKMPDKESFVLHIAFIYSVQVLSGTNVRNSIGMWLTG